MVRTGIIGCGNVAHIHAQALRNIPECSLIAVQNRTYPKAEAFAKQYGVKACERVEDMVTKEKVEVVIICTPHPEHKQPALEALNAGAHVLVEKPLASSLEDCDRMIEAARKGKRKLGVVSQRRFFESCRRMKKAIDDGKIGRPVMGTVSMLGWRDQKYYESAPWRGTWKGEGGGVLVNQSPHPLDIFQWLMNDDIEEVYGLSRNLNHPYIEVEDTALAIVKFKQGGIGNIIVSNSQRPGIHGKVHIHGKNGASVGVQTESGAMFIAGMSTILRPPEIDIWTIPGEESNIEAWKQEDEAFFKTIDPVEYYIRLQDLDFIQSIIQDRSPAITGEEGRKTVALFTAIYESSDTRKAVTLTPKR